MIKDKKCLLTSYEEGALVQSTGLFVTEKKVGDFTITKRNFVRRVKYPSEVSKSTTLTEEFVSFATSEEGITGRFNKSSWRGMSNTQRLRANLYDLVGHTNFKYELV